jgi:hypothetical protein
METDMLKKILNLALLPFVAALAAVAYYGERYLTHSLTQNFPDLSAFKNFMVTKLNDVEVIRQSIYDTVIYPLAGSANIAFFQLPLGQGLSASPGNANAVKALADTNMQMAGALPAPQGFWIQSIEVDVQPGSSAVANTYAIQTVASSAAAPVAGTGIVQILAVNELHSILASGSLVLTIGQKPYLQEAPLLRFPPKCRFELDAAMGGNSATTANFGALKLKAGGRPYILEPGLALMTSQNFTVNLLWPVVVATTNNAAIRLILDGWLFRGVQ